MPHSHLTGGAYGELGEVTIVPGGSSCGHTKSRMDEGIRLLPNTHQELTYNMCLPGQLGWIGNVLPMTATICEQGIRRIDAFGSRAQNLQKRSTCMPTTFFDDFHTYSLARDTTRDEEYTTFIAAYSVASVGKVGEFNINAHVHLQTALLT
jgi:hypothetical protein